MFTRNPLLAAASAALFIAAPAFAAGPAGEVRRDVNQQQRIEQGLKSGELDTREAATLERGEARADRMQQKALSDGKLSPEEARRIQGAQNAESQRIYNLKHNDTQGNPNSASSQRMQADVQRNVNQQQRIKQGIQSGSLTNKETAKLEGGQARADRKEARAGADGHVGPNEQRRIQKGENVQSRRIYNRKHDEVEAKK